MATTTTYTPDALPDDLAALRLRQARYWREQEHLLRIELLHELADRCAERAANYERAAAEDTRLSDEEWRETESATRMLGLVVLWMLAVVAGALALAVLP